MSEDERSSARPTHRHGLPNPDVLGFVSLGALGPGVADFAEAAEAVARRLGRPVTLVDAAGYDDEIVAGAVDQAGARFAWLQCRSKETGGGYVDISFRLRAEVADRVTVDWEPKSYNPYFGVNPIVLEWAGDGLVFVYCEKHHTYRATFDAAGRPRLERLSRGGTFVPEAEAERQDRERRAATHAGATRRQRVQRWWWAALAAAAFTAAVIIYHEMTRGGDW